MPGPAGRDERGQARRSSPERRARARLHARHGHGRVHSELEQTLEGLLRRLHLHHLARHAGRRPVLALFTVLNACISIGLIAAIAIFTGTAFLFPSLGSSAFLMFSSPSAPAASPRNTLVGQALAVAMGYLSLHVTRMPAMASGGIIVVDWPHVLAATLALGLTVGLMVLLNVEHPPAASTALLIGLGALHDPLHLGLLLVAVLLLVVQAVAINRFAGVRYPLWSPLPPESAAASKAAPNQGTRGPAGSDS